VPKLIVSGGYEKAQVFQVPVGTTKVGRELDSDLTLPNTSVSRQHALLTWDEQYLIVEDQQSQNGVLVNNKRLSKTSLDLGDVITIGKFNLEVIADDTKFFEGRFVEYMPAYTPKNTSTRGQTLSLGTGEIEKLMKKEDMWERARVVSAASPSNFWCPENHTLTFGGVGVIPVTGMFTGGIAAEITFQDDHHVLTKKKALATVKVNGIAVTTQALNENDTFQVGKTTFTYDLNGQHK